MSMAEIAIKSWSGSTKGAADDIEKFGEPSSTLENAILRAHHRLSNLFLDRSFTNDLGAVPLEFHGAATLFSELQDFTNTTVSYRTVRQKRQNAFFVDLMSNLAEFDLPDSELSDLKARLAAYKAVSNTLEESIVARYSSISPVRLIVTESYRKEKIFVVVFNSETYDEDLMDSLLDAEIELLEKFPAQLFSFRYIPFGSEHLENFQVPDLGKVLFRG